MSVRLYQCKKIACTNHLVFLVFRKDSQPNFIMKALIGSTAGCIAAVVGTPAEVALIRMTADGRLPIGMLGIVS